MQLAPSDPTAARSRFYERQARAAAMMDVAEALSTIAAQLDQLASRVDRATPGAFESMTEAAATAERMSWVALRHAGWANREGIV